jgi:hypothetical protein
MAINMTLLKTIMISVVSPLLIAVIGVIGNNQLTSWRLEDLEKNSANIHKVKNLEMKLDNYIELQNESNKLMLGFMTQKGAQAYTKSNEKMSATNEEKVDIYFAYQAEMLLKKMDQLQTSKDAVKAVESKK